MTNRTYSRSTSLRLVSRSIVIGFGVASVTLGAPAMADTPVGWPTPPHVTPLDFLMVVLIIPGTIALLITGLVLLVTRDKGSEDRSWQGERAWFGGPKNGIDDTDPRADPASRDDTGGRGGHW